MYPVRIHCIKQFQLALGELDPGHLRSSARKACSFTLYPYTPEVALPGLTRVQFGISSDAPPPLKLFDRGNMSLQNPQSSIWALIQQNFPAGTMPSEPPPPPIKVEIYFGHYLLVLAGHTSIGHYYLSVNH